MYLAEAVLSVCNGWLDHPEGPHTAEQTVANAVVGALKEEFLCRFFMVSFRNLLCFFIFPLVIVCDFPAVRRLLSSLVQKDITLSCCLKHRDLYFILLEIVDISQWFCCFLEIARVS